MFNEILGSEYIVTQDGTSEGTQIKYRKGEFWYKKDNRGREGLTEYLASHFLRFTNLSSKEYVLYEQGYINHIPGCRSKNFLLPEDELITFYRLYYNEFGQDLSKIISCMDTMEKRIEYVLKFIETTCSLDITDYLSKVFTLDKIILNEDRHLNNLALILRNGKFIPAPIFDQGISLLTANQSVNWHFSIEDNVKRVIARPFCGSHDKMFSYFGAGFQIDYPKFYEWISKEPPSREKEILEFQVREYEKKKF